MLVSERTIDTISGVRSSMSTVTEPHTTRHDDSLPGGDILYEMVDGKLVEKDVSVYAAWIALLLSRRMADY